MDVEPLLNTMAPLIWPDHGDLACSRPGHPAGHTCLPAPGAGPRDLAEAVSGRYGSPVGGKTPLPPLPFPSEHVRAWAFGGRWIRLVREDTGPCLVVTDRTVPGANGVPADASWVDRLVAVTGWASNRVRTIDWAPVEAELGTRLPRDYKVLLETFGRGQFDGFQPVHFPRDVLRTAAFHARHGQRRWEPHPPFPAPGGVLVWATNEHEQTFHWLTGGPDPDRWRVYATEEGIEPGEVFDCSATEFLYRQLTDPGHGFRIPAAFRAHWFESWED